MLDEDDDVNNYLIVDDITLFGAPENVYFQVENLKNIKYIFDKYLEKERKEWE